MYIVRRRGLLTADNIALVMWSSRLLIWWRRQQRVSVTYHIAWNPTGLSWAVWINIADSTGRLRQME